MNISASSLVVILLYSQALYSASRIDIIELHYYAHGATFITASPLFRWQIEAALYELYDCLE
jgi:drug/metabolite transporter superfamily protein YnfA